MKNPRDHALELLEKAGHDLVNARTVLPTGAALDTVCFHAQQATEKSLKALLALCDVPFPWRHDLGELSTLVKSRFPEIAGWEEGIVAMAPYAVEVRYDGALNPDLAETREAVKIAEEVYSFVCRKAAKVPK
ncbi:MAG: HEPN domain-containing protein [Planctomycetota bacterium]